MPPAFFDRARGAGVPAGELLRRTEEETFHDEMARQIVAQRLSRPPKASSRCPAGD